VLPKKFQLIWPDGFREDFFSIGKSLTRTAYGSHRNFVQAKRFQRRCLEAHIEDSVKRFKTE
jgi:hypothetical protein